MKKFVTFFFAIATIAFAMTSCKGKNSVSSDPKAVLVAFFEKMSKKDIDGAALLATKDSKATMDMMKKGMEMAEKMKTADDMTKVEDDPAEEFKQVEIGEAKINGDNATVAFKNKKKDVSFDFPLKKEDGSWKVDFSMATLMKMGMEQRGKMGIEEGDGDTEMDLQNLNMDSIQSVMKKADSLLKNMTPEQKEQMNNLLKNVQKLKQ